METSLIELKENASLKTTDEENGEYSISLKKNLTLNNGDELVIKNVFIDTIASSGGLIVLEEDTTVTMNFCRAFGFNTDIVNNTTGTAANQLLEPDGGYRVNLEHPTAIDQRHSQSKDERDTASPVKRGDGFTFFQLEEKTIPGGNNFIKATNIRFTSEINSRGYSGHYGGTAVTFAFKGIDGLVQDISITLVNADATESGKSTTQGITSFIFDSSWKGDGRGQMVYTGIEYTGTIDHLEHHNLADAFDFSAGSSVVPAGDFFNLKQETQSFTIPKGAYDPNDLARIITDNCVKRPNSQFKSFDSTDVQVFPFSTPMYGQANNHDDDGNMFFLSSDSQVLLNLTRGANNVPICGCNQFSFIFDESTRTFKFVSLHTPYYVDISAGGQSNLQIGNKYTVRGNSSNNEKQPFMDSKRGEIIFMGLSAVDESGDQVDFWFGKLGLNPTILAGGHQNYNPFKYRTTGGVDVTVNVPFMVLEPGVNQTDAFLGADSIMDDGIFVPTTADYNKTINFANLMTTPVFGLKTLGEITDTQGYFLIEIAGYNNNVRVIGNSDIGANISAIVSRYYASTAYTNGYVSDAIPYIHRGDPITLSNFRIRILDPGHKISADIGNDSSIFLTINRALQNPEPVPVPSPKGKESNLKK